MGAAPRSPMNHELDAELARWLRLRSARRVAHDREPSPLDGIAMSLRRVRSTLSFVDAGTDSRDAATSALVARAYRWSVRIARELDTIERLGLDPIKEWARIEAFAPFALAFFDSVLAAPFATAKRTPELSRLRREIDFVLAPLSLAMTSSAIAA